MKGTMRRITAACSPLILAGFALSLIVSEAYAMVPEPVPEPGTLSLLGLGLVSLGILGVKGRIGRK